MANFLPIAAALTRRSLTVLLVPRKSAVAEVPSKVVPITLLLVAWLASSPVAASESSGEALLPEIRIGAADWTPYFFGGRQAEPRGSAVEILEICLPELGFAPVFEPATIDEIFAGLKSDRFQLHVLSYRPERADYLIFGEEPMFYSGYRPFVRKGLQLESRDPSALDELRLAHRREMKYSPEFDAYIKRRLAAGGVLVVDSDEEGLRAVAEGRVDAVPLMLSTALRHRRSLGLEEKVDVAMGFDIKTAGYRVAVTKTRRIIEKPEIFLKGMDECLRALKNDGRYDEIGERYADLVD